MCTSERSSLSISPMDCPMCTVLSDSHFIGFLRFHNQVSQSRNLVQQIEDATLFIGRLLREDSFLIDQ